MFDVDIVSKPHLHEPAMGTERQPPRRLRGNLSLFAMAAWKRMAIGLGALLLLWLAILWATRL